jgi:hypothetical protein
MTRILPFIFLLFTVSAFSQNRINLTRAQVKEEISVFTTGKEKMQVETRESDSTLEYSLRSPGTIATDLVYVFDRNGKCRMEKVIVYCDTCLTEYLQPILEKKEFQWNKINENQYVSSYEKKLLLELPLGESERSFIILRADWTEKLYNLLTGKNAGN